MALSTLISQISLMEQMKQKLGEMLTTTPVPIKPKRLTKLQTARKQAQQAVVEIDGKTKWYIRRVDTALVLQTFGALVPLRNGRPIAYAQHLLEGVPSPIGGQSYDWQSCGLMFYTPHIIGNRKSRARTTLAGLALLKYWAERVPAFAPFYAAYATRKAEDEIAVHCVDLFLGIMPTTFQRALEANERIIKRNQEKRKADMHRDAMTYRDLVEQASNNISNAQNLYGAHSHSLNINEINVGAHTHSIVTGGIYQSQQILNQQMLNAYQQMQMQNQLHQSQLLTNAQG